MRLFLAIEIIVFVLTGATAAAAADLRFAPRAQYANYAVTGWRAAPTIVYDDESGVIERAYWLPPWRNHHYFPFGHDRWDRRKAQSYVRPRPAQSFHQYWSNARFFVGEAPRVIARPQAAPQAQRPIFEK